MGFSPGGSVGLWPGYRFPLLRETAAASHTYHEGYLSGNGGGGDLHDAGDGDQL
jgi:hypothetical protein